MKGKFKLLGHIGLVLFLVSVLMLAVMPVAQAGTAVTEVWVDFEDADSQNDVSSTSNVYLVHFKANTALSRGVDTVTVTWPDGSTAMGGSAFSVASTMTAGEVKFSTNYESSAREDDLTWTTCTATPTVGGYRSKVTTPIDISAGQDVWIRFASDDITAATAVGGTYKVYVSTSQDTTPVLSSVFGLDDTVLGAPAVTISPASAGASSEYVIFIDSVTTGLAVDTDTVTVQFPVGTVLPSSISASNVQFGLTSAAYTSTGTTPIVDQDKRTVTAVTSKVVSDAGDLYMKITSAAGVTNPTEAATTDEALYKVMCCTSKDRQFKVSGAYAVTAGAAVAVKVCDGEVGLDGTYYSDDATMVNMYSHRIFVTMADTYGNAKLVSGGVTVTPSASSGALYKNSDAGGAGTFSEATTLTVDAATPDEEQTVYFRGDTAGTHTLTFTASNYTDATWTFTVCPGVSLYDSSNNLIKTYGPTATVLAAETNPSSGATDVLHVGADYINDANDAAMAGDTIKLGDGIYEFDNDDVTYPWSGGGVGIQIDKKITLTSVNGASSTTLRNTEDVEVAVYVTCVDGTATYPIIIDGLTFQRLRKDTDIYRAVLVDGSDYVTVRNCVFNYIMPNCDIDYSGGKAGPGAVVGYVVYNAEANLSGVTDDITSATVSNNTFNNCSPFAPPSGETANILMFSRVSGGEELVGGVISGNTLTNCGGRGICVKGNLHTAAAGYLYVTASITNNTITNPYTGIDLEAFTKDVVVTGNTITGAYRCGIEVSDYNWGDSTNGYYCHDGAVVKNNTVTGTAGDYAINVSSTDVSGGYEINSVTFTPTAPVVQYNNVSGSNGYAIRARAATAASTGQDCKYNYYGDASGPYYSALTGATVLKSNPNGTGDKITDRVTYYPWLHKSRADVVADNASYQTCNMQLIVGWNTLSTPAKLIDSANSIDELIPSGMSIGYYYDGGWQLITTGYTLSPCDAVYVKMSAATYVQFKIDASAFSTPSKDLVAGWNLIGLSDLTVGGMDTDDAVISVYKTAGNLPGYSHVISPSQNAAQYDIYYTAGGDWTVTMAEHGGSTSNMLPGLGYWIYMQNPATLAGFVITPIVPDLD